MAIIAVVLREVPGGRGLAPRLVRAGAVASGLCYVTLLALAWALSASIGYDGVLRPAAHEVGSGASFTVLEVEPGSPADRAGVVAGDVVLAVDGNPFVYDLHQAYHNRRAGQEGSLRLVHGGETRLQSITLESRLASPSIVLGLATASVLGLALVAVGAGVACIRPEHWPARLLFIFALGLAVGEATDLWHWAQRTARAAGLVDLVSSGALLFGGAALLHLAVAFPAPRPLNSWVRRGIHALYLCAVLPLGLSGFGEDVAWVLPSIVLVGLLVASLVLLELSYRRPPTPLARAQLAWIRWGLAIGVAATALHKLASLASRDALPAGVGTVVAAAWLVFPVALAFAVLRYRLFEVDRVVRASVTWGVLAGLLLASYLVIVVVVGRIATSVIGPAASDNPTAAVIAALIVAAVAHPVRVRLMAALDRHVYRQRLTRSRLLARAGDLLGQTQTPTTVANFLCHDVSAELKVSNGWLAVSTSCVPLFEAEQGVLPPNVSVVAATLVESMRLAGHPVLLARAEDLAGYEDGLAISAEQPGVTPWYAAGARALVPIRGTSDGALLALWALGAPASGDLFDRDDLDAISRVARMAGLQLERAVLQVSVPIQAASRPPTLATSAVRGPAPELTWRRDALPAPMTARETEVLALLARGYSNQRIADHLVIGVRTVETHVEHILRKLQVKSRADAMVWAREQAASDPALGR